jgi:hypothetical protein
VAGALSRQYGAQFLRGAVAVGDELGILPQLPDEPGGAALAGRQVAGKMHAAHHALARECSGARQQPIPALGHHVGE